MQEKTYEDLIDEANEARIATNDAAAIELYHRAIKIGGPRDTEAHWMLGVSLINNEEYSDALVELNQVLKDCDESDKPNALRDRARAYGKLKKFDESTADITSSLKQLEASGNKSEYGATLGFGARLKLEQENVEGALADFVHADEVLKAADNRHYELYNKMHYAEALVNHGSKQDAEAVLAEAETLIPQYGGEKHSKRAQELRDKLAGKQ
jgi:tetratricopeptide (TPR) repeat protein